jgi:hypothetical protein
MMQYILTFILLSFSITAVGQHYTAPVAQIPIKKKWVKSDHAIYTGVSIGTLGEQYLRAEYEVTEAYMILQASFQVGPQGLGVQYKMGAGYAPKDSPFRIYAYIPYFNMSIDEMGYNTPFCIEAFYGRGKLQGSVNIDIYTEGVVLVPSIRVRYRLIKFKL